MEIWNKSELVEDILSKVKYAKSYKIVWEFHYRLQVLNNRCL